MATKFNNIQIMKKLLILLLSFIVVFNSYSGMTNTTVGVSWDPGQYEDPTVVGTYLYISTNDISINHQIRLFNPPLVYTNNDIPLMTNVLVSMYVTSVDTNSLDESIPSNQIRVEMLPYVRGVSSRTYTLKSYTNVNWSAFQLLEYPKNGVISGTLPNLTYTITNTAYFNNDKFVYKSPEVFYGTNINYYYALYFYWVNPAPVLREILLK